MPLISRKKYNTLQSENAAMRAELKGYYDQGANADNRFFRQIQARLRSIELPPLAPVSRDKIIRIYETSAPVMGVVNKIATAVGDVAQHLELTGRDGDEVGSHWLLDVLRQPNDRYNLRRFITGWAVNKLLFGDAWVYAPKTVGKDRGRIREMYLLPSHLVEAKRDGIFQPLRDVTLLGSLKDETISVDDIFSSFDYNPDPASFFGTSRIVAAAVYLSVMERGMRREDTSLNNGGVANIVTPAKDTLGVMPQDADAVEERFNRNDNTGKTLTLRIPVDVHQLGNAPVDLNILESHKEAVTALCFVYGLPVDLYYGQAKYENAKVAKQTIYDTNAIPLCNEFAEDLLGYTGLSREGYRLTVNTDRIDVLQDSPGDVLNNLANMHATLNEMREAYGYPRIEEPYADQPILPLGVQFGAEGVNDISEI